MPRDYDDDDFIELGPVSAADSEFVAGLLYVEAGDPIAQEMFDVFLDPEKNKEAREQSYADLCDYLWETYGIDFPEAFDWEDFRDWYDAA